ncbi:MAG: hypothetical protein HYX39_10235 [Bacteroidetes bacterium]|nr:hypothetical protein [Bacteroidota bacterium]
MTAIIFSFSVNTYDSLHKLSLNDLACCKNAQINPYSEKGCTSDNVFFEEQELEDNDKACLTQAFQVLPYIFRRYTPQGYHREGLVSVTLGVTTQPLFISR